jgi:hypothetical protein
VVITDLCEVYGCDLCPGWVKNEDNIPVFCEHECHRMKCDA